MVQYTAPRLDTTFAALADATRRGVLEQLGRSDASITDLAGRFRMTLTGMKKHVGVLEQAGLVTTRKVGRVRTCQLGPRRMEDAVADDVPAFLEENVRWHWALAVASGNELLRAFMASIAGLIHDASRAEHVETADVRAVVVKAHRRILQAIRQRDGEAARRRMERHVKAYSAQIRGAGQSTPPGRSKSNSRGDSR